MKKRYVIEMVLAIFALMIFSIGCSNQTDSTQTANANQGNSGSAEVNTNEEGAQDNKTNEEMSLDDLPDISQIPLDSGDAALLTSDENMDLSFVSADTTNGIIFEVNNKTDKNLNWQYDSIALNKRSINSRDFYVSSGNIAPNSIGEVVISFDVSADTSKYDWSEGVSTVSGQLRYFIGEGYNDMVSVSFSDVAV